MTVLLWQILLNICFSWLSSCAATGVTADSCCLAGSQRLLLDSNCVNVDVILHSSRSDSVNRSESCVNEMKRCCRKELAAQNCQQGILRALKDQTCTSLKTARAEECCQSCYDGLSATACAAPWLEEEPLLYESFDTCCQQKKKNLQADQPVEFTRRKRMFKQLFCPDGFHRRNDECVDVDECGNDVCPSGYECKNRKKGYDCMSQPYRPQVTPTTKCQDGFIFSDHLQQCIDRDDCAENANRCGYFQVCMNVIGGSLCVSRSDRLCASGYKFVEGNGCVDVDECLGPNDCSSNQTCVNRNGHYRCVPQCEIGSKIDPITLNCLDFDECSTGRAPCKDSELCENKEFGFGCNVPSVSNVCGKGFEADEMMNCVDIDECAHGNPCGDDAYCVNTEGSFACSRPCGSGYLHMNGTCIDFDECSRSNNLCKFGQACVNLPGSYKCVDRDCEAVGKVMAPDGSCLLRQNCPHGFYHNVTVDRCTDVDECEESPCSVFAICENTIGSYRCIPKTFVECRVGMRRTSDGTKCLNINECDEGLDDCDRLTQECRDTFGSYACDCKRGFALNAMNNCERDRCAVGFRYDPVGNECKDINECMESRGHGSLCDQICVNTHGSYECLCYSGYESDPVAKNKCRVSDKCSTLNCNGNCEMKNGTLQCVCPEGFKKRNGLCVDIDECRIPGSHNCSSAKSCMNIEGGFMCRDLHCPTNYTRDEVNMRCSIQEPCADCPESMTFIYVSLRKHSQRKPVSVKLNWNPKMTVSFSYNIDNVVRGRTNVEAASRDHFILKQNKGSAKIVLQKPLRGPQEVYLTLMADIRSEHPSNEPNKRVAWLIYLYVPGFFR